MRGGIESHNRDPAAHAAVRFGKGYLFTLGGSISEATDLAQKFRSVGLGFNAKKIGGNVEKESCEDRPFLRR